MKNIYQVSIIAVIMALIATLNTNADEANPGNPAIKKGQEEIKNAIEQSQIGQGEDLAAHNTNMEQNIGIHDDTNTNEHDGITDKLGEIESLVTDVIAALNGGGPLTPLGVPCSLGDINEGTHWIGDTNAVCDANNNNTWARQVVTLGQGWQAARDYCSGLGAGWQLPTKSQYSTIFLFSTEEENFVELSPQFAGIVDPATTGAVVLFWTLDEGPEDDTLAFFYNLRGEPGISEDVPKDSTRPSAFCVRPPMP